MHVGVLLNFMMRSSGRLFLCLAPMVVGPAGSRSVVQILWLLERVWKEEFMYPHVCYQVCESENVSCVSCVKIDFFALKPIRKT